MYGILYKGGNNMENLKTITIDLEKRIFKINGEDVSKAKSMKIEATPEGVSVVIEKEYFGQITPF